MDLYLIPGLGADHRIFSKLETGDHAVHHLDWPEMPRGSTLHDFAVAMSVGIDAQRPHALIGMSMGGMVAQEMAAITDPAMVVIISSWKGPHEMPPALRMLRGKHPERLLTKAFLERLMPMVRWQMGVETPESVLLFNSLVGVYNVAQLKVQIAAGLNWDGPVRRPEQLVHIHGDQDRLMPLGSVQGVQVVKGGGHFMVYDSALAVSILLKHALSKGASL